MGSKALKRKLQQRQGADAGEQQVVLKKNSKRNKKAQKEQELNSNSSEENILSENERSTSSNKGQKLNPESVYNGQQFTSKSRKKELYSGQQSNSKNSQKNHNLNYDYSSQGQELPDAVDNNEETLKVSMDAKDKKKKKNKKKRDRWGQVLNDAGNTQDTSYDGMDAAMLDDVDKPRNVAHADGDETLAKRDSYEGEYDSKTVCVGGMPYDTREEDILMFFKECGTVARVVCMKFADTQRFKGLALITFEKETAALKALSLDGANMGDRLIKVEKARSGGKVLRAPPKREAGSLSVYVGNLDWGIQKIDIKRFFKGCDIDNVRLAFDRNTGDFRGYGHVDFSDEKSLEKAIKMDQNQLRGRPVKVSYAVPKG